VRNADDLEPCPDTIKGDAMTHGSSSDSSDVAKRHFGTSLICPLVSVSLGSPVAKCPPIRRRDPSSQSFKLERILRMLSRDVRGSLADAMYQLYIRILRVLSTRPPNVYAKQQARATAKVGEPSRVSIIPFIISNTGYAFSHLRLAFLDPSLGVVYSDLGTSPLYTLNGIWPANGPLPPAEDVIGGVSAIIWAITLLPLIKYASVYLFSLSIYVTV